MLNGLVGFMRPLSFLLGAASSSLAFALANGSVPMNKEYIWLVPIIIGCLSAINVVIAQNAVERRNSAECAQVTAILREQINDWKTLFHSSLSHSAHRIVESVPSNPTRELLKERLDEIGFNT